LDSICSKEVEEEQSMPSRFEDPIEVPTAVLDGLETVRESGETNLQDSAKVQAIAARLGYPEVLVWIEEHPRAYQEGIFRGFVCAEQPLQ
jgi:hypothetical protein